MRLMSPTDESVECSSEPATVVATSAGKLLTETLAAFPKPCIWKFVVRPDV